MNSRWVQLVLILGVLITTPSQGVEISESAILLYQQHYGQSPEGVYLQGDWLFVIAEQKKEDRSHPSIYYEGKTMLKTQALLKRYVLQQADLSALKKHSVQGRLGLDIDELILSGDFYAFSLNAISIKVLENKADKIRYRRVTALKLIELSKAKLQLVAESRLENIVNYVLNQAENRSDNALLARYYFDLGLLREAYFYKWQQLSQDYYLVNYPALDSTPFQSRQLLRQVLTTPVEEYDLNWLQQLPANPELLAQVKENIGGLDRIGQSLLDILLLPAVLAEQQTMLWDRVKQALNFLEPNRSIQAELNFMQASRESMQQTVFETDLLAQVMKQQGFLIIDEKYSAEPSAQFKQAKALFEQGKSVNSVAELLRQAIRSAPRHAESWVYYGSVLKYQKKYQQALAAFQQASLLNHADTENQANIAAIYLQLKQTAIAKAYLYYLQQQPITNVSAYTQKVMTQLKQIKD